MNSTMSVTAPSASTRSKSASKTRGSSRRVTSATRVVAPPDAQPETVPLESSPPLDPPAPQLYDPDRIGVDLLRLVLRHVAARQRFEECLEAEVCQDISDNVMCEADSACLALINRVFDISGGRPERGSRWSPIALYLGDWLLTLSQNNFDDGERELALAVVRVDAIRRIEIDATPETTAEKANRLVSDFRRLKAIADEAKRAYNAINALLVESPPHEARFLSTHGDMAAARELLIAHVLATHGRPPTNPAPWRDPWPPVGLIADQCLITVSGREEVDEAFEVHVVPLVEIPNFG